MNAQSNCRYPSIGWTVLISARYENSLEFFSSSVLVSLGGVVLFAGGEQLKIAAFERVEAGLDALVLCLLACAIAHAALG